MIFVDTGAWYADEVEDDSYHPQARKFMKNELASNAYGALITTDYVLDETLTLLRTRRGVKVSTDFINKVRRSKSLQIVWIGKEIFDSAVHELSKYDDEKDRDLSFTDCTSFSTMKDLSISHVFTFDAHFQKAGFDILP
jgi:uncharacterized protein